MGGNALIKAPASTSRWVAADYARVGSFVSELGAAALDLLIGQVANPVRWDLCMASFAEHGVTGIIELTPAGTLTGLAKRALRGVPSVAVKTPDDLEAAQRMLHEHGGQTVGSPTAEQEA